MFNHIIGAMTAQHSLSSCFLKTLLHLNMLSWNMWLPVRSTRFCVGGVDISLYSEMSNFRPNMKSQIEMLHCNLSTYVSSKMIISPFGENLIQHHCYEIKETNVNLSNIIQSILHKEHTSRLILLYVIKCDCFAMMRLGHILISYPTDAMMSFSTFSIFLID